MATFTPYIRVYIHLPYVLNVSSISLSSHLSLIKSRLIIVNKCSEWKKLRFYFVSGWVWFSVEFLVLVSGDIVGPGPTHIPLFCFPISNKKKTRPYCTTSLFFRFIFHLGSTLAKSAFFYFGWTIVKIYYYIWRGCDFIVVF